jgi:PhnB protein
LPIFETAIFPIESRTPHRLLIIELISEKQNMIKINVQPYLFFNGRCEEALEFYRKALGAKITIMMRYKESPDPAAAHGAGDKIMHANISIGETQIMASDGRGDEGPNFQGFALTINAPHEAEAERLFAALADGGEVQTPLTKTFYSPRFGMVTDRFGVLWMILTAAEMK